METPGKYVVPRVKGQFDGDEERDRHNVTVTATGWQGLKEIAEECGYKSRSDVIDALGHGDLVALGHWDAAVNEAIAHIPEADQEQALEWFEILRQKLLAET